MHIGKTNRYLREGSNFEVQVMILTVLLFLTLQRQGKKKRI